MNLQSLTQAIPSYVLRLELGPPAIRYQAILAILELRQQENARRQYRARNICGNSDFRDLRPLLIVFSCRILRCASSLIYSELFRPSIVPVLIMDIYPEILSFLLVFLIYDERLGRRLFLF